MRPGIQVPVAIIESREFGTLVAGASKFSTAGDE